MSSCRERLSSERGQKWLQEELAGTKSVDGNGKAGGGGGGQKREAVRRNVLNGVPLWKEKGKGARGVKN